MSTIPAVGRVTSVYAPLDGLSSRCSSAVADKHCPNAHHQQSLHSDALASTVIILRHGRPHIGANGVSYPPGKMAEKLKSENMQKRAVF